MSEDSGIIQSLEPGDLQSTEELLPLVYNELRRLAATKMSDERSGQTLQPTALVHEAWLKLKGRTSKWQNRTHFINAAAEAMRRILVDRARIKSRAKRGGGWVREDLESIDLTHPSEDEWLLLVNAALGELEAKHPVHADVVKLRYFAGLNHAEVGEALGLSEKTVRRYWNFAKLVMFQDIKSRH